MILIVVAVVVLIGGFIAASKMYKEKEVERLNFVAKEDFKKFVPDYAPKLGTSTPEVYLVEFLDPECESCRAFHPLVKMLMSEFEGKVQLVIRYAPFHGNSRLVIKILEAARIQGKYWETLEVLFQYQPQWGSHHHPRPDLIWKYLPEAGVDLNRIREDMHNPEIEAMIEREITDGRELGVRATPSFFVNGKPLETFGIEPLRELIRQNLK
jgi:protein-disulfide isomerase